MSDAASDRTPRPWTGRLWLMMLPATHLTGGAASAAEFPPLSHGLTALGEPTPAPASRLQDLGGRPHDLADFRGRLVLVNSWATRCPPCRREMPSLEGRYQQLRDRGLKVVAVDLGQDADTVFAFAGQLDPPPTFPMLLDPDGLAAPTWRVKGLPTSFLIDPQGRVILRAVGGTEFDHPATLEQLLPYLPTP